MLDVFVADKKTETKELNNEKANESLADSIARLKKQHMHFFSTYVEQPEKITFENQDEKENILLFLRQHWIVNLPWITTTILLSLLPFIFFLFNNLFSFDIPFSFLIIIISFYYLIIIGYVLLNFISWFYNISLITDQEVVDVDYSHVTYKNIASATLDHIQDVEYIQTGFLRTLFNYGDVFIQTAGENPNIEFLRVPQPGKVSDIIIDEKKRKKKE